MSPKPITHSRWLRGLQSGFDRYSQPKGSVARVSNLVMTRRGAWKTCDGTQIITEFNNTLQSFSANFGPITEVFLFQPIGGTIAYYGIVKSIQNPIGAPTGLAAAAGAAGALTGVYKYVITALDGAGGETTQSNEATVTLTAQKGSLTWTPVANAEGGYNIYRTVAGGSTNTEHFVATVAGQSTAAYTDNTPDGSLGPGVPPSLDTTQVCLFYNFTTPSYVSPTNVIFTFPADTLPFLPDGGGGGSGHGPGPGSGTPSSPQGGTAGNLSPLPMILQFTNKMILALGNGITPYFSDGTTPGTTQITNTFSATYPARAASTAFNQGAQIQVNIGGTLYVFTAAQGGITTAGGPPAFSATLGSTVPDGSGSTIIWKNSGQVSNSPPPRGAAHAEVYAGSLWVANTGVTTSSDQLDGPSALRMSDLNNPISWNPLNAAQIAPDDGDQCTGIKAFTVAEAGIAPQNFLMYFKNYSSYLIQGVFGATNFSITRLQTDLGCIAARTIQFIPGYGIMRLTHLGFAVTDGISDKLQDPEAIRPYLYAESTESDIATIDQSYVYFSKAAQTANPPMYVCAVPLLTVLAGTIPPVTISAASGLLPSATYFVIVQKIFQGGIVFQTAEVSIGPCTGIHLSLPDDGTRNYVWRVFFGTASGAENNAVFIPAGGGSNTTITSTVGVYQGPLRSSFGFLSRIFCYDLILKEWTVVDLPFPISVLRQFRKPGSNPITVMAGFADGALRRWQAGDTNWDAGATNAFAEDTIVDWSFRDAEVYVEGGTVNLFHNQVVIRGDGAPSAISVTPTVNGRTQTVIQAALTAMGLSQFEGNIRILQTARNLNLTVSGAGPAVIESIDYEVMPKPVGSSVVIG
jgi:hypothetical protein